MTDKEKIRAEIESRLKRLTDGCVGQRYAYRTLLEFIDSLPEEPVSEELEEAASVFAREDSCGIENPANFYYVVADKARIFKTGAKWKKEKMINSAKKSKIVITSGGILLSDLKIEDFDYADKVKVIIVKENKDE